MELSVKIVKKEKPFTIFVKTAILHVWQGSEYAPELASKVKNSKVKSCLGVALQFSKLLTIFSNFSIAKNKCREI